MKWISYLLCTLLLTWTAAQAELPPHKKILINQIAEHPALNRTVQGIVDTLAAQGYTDIRIESAQAQPTLAAQIATKFVHQHPDVVVGIGTLAAQSFLKYTQNGSTTLIFSSVTDPVGAGLNSPNISGVSNFVDLKPQLQLFKTLQPHLKRLGILYNPAELNSISLNSQLEALVPQFDIQLHKQAIMKTADVAQNATKLATQVDAIFISNDSTALSSLPSIIKAANQQNIPVYVSDTDTVSQGALAALGPNQYTVGQQTGAMIVRFLQGTPLASLSVEFPTKTELYLNADTAKRLGITLTAELLKTATQVIDTAAQ